MFYIDFWLNIVPVASLIASNTDNISLSLRLSQKSSSSQLTHGGKLTINAPVKYLNELGQVDKV